MGSRVPLLDFWDPPNSSGTNEARNFKFGIEMYGVKKCTPDKILATPMVYCSVQIELRQPLSRLISPRCMLSGRFFLQTSSPGCRSVADPGIWNGGGGLPLP